MLKLILLLCFSTNKSFILYLKKTREVKVSSHRLCSLSSEIKREKNSSKQRGQISVEVKTQTQRQKYLVKSIKVKRRRIKNTNKSYIQLHRNHRGLKNEAEARKCEMKRGI